MSAEESDSPGGSSDELPGIDFSTFLLSLGHSALVNLGMAPEPGGDQIPADLVMARQTIDLIALLSEKTKGNLTGEEERIVEHLLYDLRSRYVEVASSQK